jgi:hypothetical protein
MDRGLLILLVIYVLLLPVVTKRIYASDEIKYFSYLHSLYFDGDLRFEDEFMHFYNSDPKKFADFKTGVIDKREPLTDNPVNEAPIGSALLWSPFYIATDLGLRGLHALGLFKSTLADGYSTPYVWAVCYGSNLLGFLGILLAYRLARKYFSVFAATLATLVVWFATPAFFYMYISPPWSHATSLFAVAAFITYWHDTRLRRVESEKFPVGAQFIAPNAEQDFCRGGINPAPTDAGVGVGFIPPANPQLSTFNFQLSTLRAWFLLGLLGGLVMCVREQDGLFALIPAVEAAVFLIGWLRARDWAAVGRLMIGGVVFLVGLAIGFAPQLAAYHATNGTWTPSKTVGEKINLLSPHFFEVLFSPQNGLLPWTSVVLFCLLGLIALWRSDRIMTAAFASACFAQVYVAGAFSTWQGKGSFGQRRFVNITIILIMGLAALISWMLHWAANRSVAVSPRAGGSPPLHSSNLKPQTYVRWALAIVGAIFVAWNFGLALQFALWTSEQRQGLDWGRVVSGQISLLNPANLFDILRRFIFDRSSFYKLKL